MRATATWSGTISFGIVAIPVQLYAATEEHTVRLHEIHTADGGRVQHRRFCAAEGREISYSEVGRGVALPDGRMLPLSEDDLARLPLPTKRTITVVGFIDPQGVIPISYDRPYYVAPAARDADRPYALLVEVLSRTGLVAMAKVAIRSRERKAVLRPYRGLLLLQTLRWSDEIRDPGDLAHLVPAVPLSDRERRLAEVLVKEMIGVDDSVDHDGYAHALEQLVDAVASGDEPAEPPPQPEPAVDLMTALQQSVDEARAARHPTKRPSKADRQGK
ncbi:Ku protein [Streptomyces sp. NPDC050121]|uniref:non-homologous end joining protein Ku n=1 Tax=Streptomyces sp. NPDC050121 TaxID=3365601 RepID=UPI0037BBCE5E